MKAPKSILLVLILNLFIFNNCNISGIKTQTLEGYVIDDKTELPLKGVVTYLVKTGWEDYNSSILQETQTDENGYYQFEFEDTDERYEGWHYGVGLPNYITPDIPHLETYGIVTVDGNEYNYAQSPMGVRIYRSGQDMTFRLRPSAYFKVHFKNINPVDSNDLAEFKPGDEPLVKMKGMSVDTMVIARRWTHVCDHPLIWHITKGNDTSFRFNKSCCEDGDTCLIEAFY